MAMAAVAFVLFVAVFLLVQMEWLDRGLAMLGGAMLFLLLGQLFHFYRLDQAMDAVYFDSLALLFGMSLISNCLSRSGLFHRLALNTVLYARGNLLLILVLLVMVTYTASLVFNNLSVMVILMPVTLVVCQALARDPALLVTAELVASNLGGASTLVGDFPNMIIGAVARLHFDDFIGGMMVPCLVLLATLLLFMQKRLGVWHTAAFDPDAVRQLLIGMAPRRGALDPYLVRVGGWVFVLTLAGFFVAQPLGIRPAVISFVAGLVVLGLGRSDPQEWFRAASGSDVLFFLGLFVMVGGLQATGVLEGLHQMVLTLGGGNHTLSLLILMWLACLVTPLFNAGPATALLVPVAKAVYGEIPDSAVWWALSLGVLAGSSASLSGATAGPLVASFMANHVRQVGPGSGMAVLDFRRYLQWGLPVAALFLGISSVYIIMIAQG